MNAPSLPVHEDPELARDFAEQFVAELAAHNIDFGLSARYSDDRRHLCRTFVDKVVDRIRRGFLDFASPSRLTTRQLNSLDDMVYTDVLTAQKDAANLTAEELLISIFAAYATFGCTITRGKRHC